jgi:hypothetical protein
VVNGGLFGAAAGLEAAGVVAWAGRRLSGAAGASALRPAAATALAAAPSPPIGLNRAALRAPSVRPF